MIDDFDGADFYPAACERQKPMADRDFTIVIVKRFWSLVKARGFSGFILPLRWLYHGFIYTVSILNSAECLVLK